MAQWSKDRAPLPRDWELRRQRVFQRDKWRCQLGLSVCTGRAVEVDHIDRNDDHRLVNLRAVCSACHRVRTQEQAAEATRAMWARTRVPEERHPGLL